MRRLTIAVVIGFIVARNAGAGIFGTNIGPDIKINVHPPDVHLPEVHVQVGPVTIDPQETLRNAKKTVDQATDKGKELAGAAAGAAQHAAGQLAKGASDASKTATAITSAMGRMVSKGKPDAVKDAFAEAAKGATTLVTDIQRAQEQANEDLIAAGMKALPADVSAGAQHLSAEAAREVRKNPALASAVLAVLNNPALSAAIRLALASPQSCNPGQVISQLSGGPERGVNDWDKVLSVLTTPVKYQGISGWVNTGCHAEAVGIVATDAQISGDNLWTIDVMLLGFAIGPTTMTSHTRFIRIEVEPLGRAHDLCNYQRIRQGDTISFGGPVLIDSDGPFLEVHPIDDLQILAVGSRQAMARAAASVQSLPPAAPAPASGTGRTSDAVRGPVRLEPYTVKPGDTLATIAQRYHLAQSWAALIKANRRLLGEPDHLVAGQVINVPNRQVR